MVGVYAMLAYMKNSLPKMQRVFPYSILFLHYEAVRRKSYDIGMSYMLGPDNTGSSDLWDEYVGIYLPGDSWIHLDQ